MSLLHFHLVFLYKWTIALVKKNWVMFGYLESLLAATVFKNVVGFLPEGHRHEGIDQKFSRTAEWHKNIDAIISIDLHDELRLSYKNAVVMHMQPVANWSLMCEQEKYLPMVSSSFNIGISLVNNWNRARTYFQPSFTSIVFSAS